MYERIYEVVRHIPKGKVATYGQIAALSQCSGPRQVGYALHASPEGTGIPWHRVINAKGEISLPIHSPSALTQRSLLELEGIAFSDFGRVSLKRFRWMSD